MRSVKLKLTTIGNSISVDTDDYDESEEQKQQKSKGAFTSTNSEAQFGASSTNNNSSSVGTPTTMESDGMNGEYDPTSRGYETFTFKDEALNKELTEGCSEDLNSYHQSNIATYRGAIPKFPDSKLTDEEKQWVAACIEKLRHMEGVDPKKIQTISQNCVLADRFKYKFFNPATEMEQDIGFGGLGTANKHTKPGLRIKFVLTEIDQSAHMRLVRRLGHTFNLAKVSPFGMFHTALIVGNWYVEWNDNSLAIVRKNSSSKAVFAFDLVLIQKEIDIHTCLDKIAQECCRWNGTQMYDNKKNNCQHCK